jgi:hypothetical protein
MNWKSKYRVIFSMLIGLVFSLFAASISTACSTPGLNPALSASWAANANVGVDTTGVPSVVTTAIANWNFTFGAAGICNAPTLIASSTTGAPKITMSYVFIPNFPCPNDPTKTCANRGGNSIPSRHLFRRVSLDGSYTTEQPNDCCSRHHRGSGTRNRTHLRVGRLQWMRPQFNCHGK